MSKKVQFFLVLVCANFNELENLSRNVILSENKVQTEKLLFSYEVVGFTTYGPYWRMFYVGVAWEVTDF